MPSSFSRATPELRASDADREATVERLRVAAVEGRLDADELGERLSAAYAARTCAELARLTVDVTPPPAARAFPAPPGRPVFVQGRARINGFAIASLVLAFFFGFGSVLAVVFGHVALSQIGRARGAQKGRAVAVAGLLLGYFGLLTMLMAFFAGLLLI